MNRLRTVSHYFIAAALSILILNLLFWGVAWMIEQPFDTLGWFRMSVDMLNYSQCTLRIDYFMQSLVLLGSLAIPVIFFIVIAGILNGNS